MLGWVLWTWNSRIDASLDCQLGSHDFSVPFRDVKRETSNLEYCAVPIGKRTHN